MREGAKDPIVQGMNYGFILGDYSDLEELDKLS